eukprot:1532169-Amphidinium_carterae.1
MIRFLVSGGPPVLAAQSHEGTYPEGRGTSNPGPPSRIDSHDGRAGQRNLPNSIGGFQPNSQTVQRLALQTWRTGCPSGYIQVVGDKRSPASKLEKKAVRRSTTTVPSFDKCGLSPKGPRPGGTTLRS